MKCPVCGGLLSDAAVGSAMPMWALWTNVLVLPTLGIAFALALYDVMGAWSLIIGFTGMVVGSVGLWMRTTDLR